MCNNKIISDKEEYYTIFTKEDIVQYRTYIHTHNDNVTVNCIFSSKLRY